MIKRVLKGLAVALLVLGLFSGGVVALSQTPQREAMASARVLDSRGREIGAMVNGRFRPHGGAVESVKLVPCSPAADHGPFWAFCRDGYYFRNIFDYRKYASAKRALAHYTGPVIIEVGGQQNQSFLKDGWLE